MKNMVHLGKYLRMGRINKRLDWKFLGKHNRAIGGRYQINSKEN